ncbi:hypothetical protein ACSVWW_004592 [Salmonella enterica]
MTTITKERIELFIKNPLENGLTRGEQMELARIAMASLEAKPVRYLNKFSGVCVTLEQQSNAADDVAVYIPLYTAQPAQETGVYKDMLNIIGLLENNEWAEHCTSTVLGSLLESEITRLVGKEQPAPVVPDDWVMVPKEPTQAMIKAWLSEVANFRGHAAGYKAALAAAPQQEVK